MMSYFIDATNELIDENGIGEITLRKVADKAGYNSATLYNYFENLDHLIFYAAMGNMQEYSNALSLYLVDAKNAMDIFLKVWECFCDYSFDKPEIYNAIFFSNLNNDMEHYIAEYYKLFPLDLTTINPQVSTMLLKRDINKRGETTVVTCVNEGYILPEDANKLNDLTLLIYEGMLRRVLQNKISYDNARNSTMDYFKIIVEKLLIKDYEFHY